jgi:signal transduction histidine kinase
MLRKLLQTQVAGSHIELAVTATGSPQPLSAEHAGHVLRIAQEAVANVSQHAQATRIEVRLIFEAENLVLEIADDGRGFDVSGAPLAEEGHFGITGMKERAATMRADLAIRSDNAGTRIVLRLPIPPPQGHFWHRLWWRWSGFKTSTHPTAHA